MSAIQQVLAAFGSVPQSITFVDSASSTNSTTITVPATAQQDDIAVLFDTAYQGGSAPADVVPSGWTGVSTGTQGDNPNSPSSYLRLRVSRIVLGASPGGTSVTGMANSGGYAAIGYKAMFVFRPAKTPTITVQDLEAYYGVNNASSTVNAGGATNPVVVFFGSSSFSGGALNPSPSADGSLANSRNAAGYKVYNSAPANVSVTTSALDRYSLVSAYLSVT